VLGAFGLGVAEEWPRAYITDSPGIEKFVAVVLVLVVLAVRPPRALGARTA
jgi:hypothetical protein